MEDLEPGDLIFYGAESAMWHCTLELDRLSWQVHLASGIKISNYDYEAPVGVGTYIEADGFFSE